MSARDPYRKLSNQIATAVGSLEGKQRLIGLHLSIEEWRLVIEALDRAAKPREARRDPDGGRMAPITAGSDGPP